MKREGEGEDARREEERRGGGRDEERGRGGEKRGTVTLITSRPNKHLKLVDEDHDWLELVLSGDGHTIKVIFALRIVGMPYACK